MSATPDAEVEVPPGPRPPEDEDATLRRDVADLTVCLVKAMLQTSYYSPDHPAAKGVALEPFRRLQALQGRYTEITYMVQGGSDGEEMAVEGIFPDPVPLAALIKTTMGEHFATKLQAYFRRNRIVSLSIKAGIAEAEFDRFVQVFVERHLQAPDDVDAAEEARFTQQLYEREVVNVSVMLESDLVGARRKLPWRVRMAISRLRKDLRVIPLYAKATQVELRQAKELIIQDIIRPLKRPEFLKDLLVNSDLVTEDVQELRGSDIETEIIGALSRSLVAAVAWALVSDLERMTWEHVKAEAEKAFTAVKDAAKRNLRKLALRLAREESEQAHEIIRHLFDRELLGFEELPPRLQQQILVERWTDEFLADEERAFARFEQTADYPVYLEQLSSFTAIFFLLVKRGHYVEAHRILTLVTTQAATPVASMPQRPRDIERALKRLRHEDTLKRLGDALVEEDEVRELVRDMLVLLGPDATPSFLRVLREAENSAARKAASEGVLAVGLPGAHHLVEDLAKHRRHWQYAQKLLLLLGDMRCEQATADLIRFLSHPNARLREEALLSLHKIRGRNAEPHLVTALGDHEWQIQRRALVLLNSIDSRRPEIVPVLAQILRVPDGREDEAEPPQALQEVAIATAVRLGNLPLPDGGSLEHVIGGIVAHGERGGLFGLFRPRAGEKARAESLRLAAIEALARIGTRDSEPVLRYATKDRSPAVKARAEVALEQLRQRTASK